MRGALILLSLLMVGTVVAQGNGGGSRRGYPPQLADPMVKPTEGYTPLFGRWWGTSFYASIKYRDSDGDAPRRLELVVAGPEQRRERLDPTQMPNNVAMNTGFEAGWNQTFTTAGDYTVTFEAEDKDGPARATQPLSFHVRNLGLLIGLVALGMLAGYALTNVVAFGIAALFAELPAAILAWCLYFIAVPTLIVSVFNWWSNVGLMVVLYGLGALAIAAMLGYAALQRRS